MLWARIATFFAALCGNATHVYLCAMTLVGGWREFVTQFHREFEDTNCYGCGVLFTIFLYVLWFGGPFYVLALPALAARSIGIVIATLLSVAGLIVLDVVMFNSGNGRDWYVILAPIVLGVIAVVGCVILGSWASANARELKQPRG